MGKRPSAAPGLVAAQDQQHFEFGTVEVWEMIENGGRHPQTPDLAWGGPDPGIRIGVLHKVLIGPSGTAL